MKTGNNLRNLVCLKCSHTKFTPVEAPVTQEFRGESLSVVTSVMSCAHCGWITLAPGQLDTLRLRTADAYRQKHGLLTAAEIRSRREILGKSQREFASFLGVGEASIPRWESWQVQEKVYDDLIRSRTQQLTAVENWIQIKWVGGLTMETVIPTALPEDWGSLAQPGILFIQPLKDLAPGQKQTEFAEIVRSTLGGRQTIFNRRYEPFPFNGLGSGISCSTAKAPSGGVSCFHRSKTKPSFQHNPYDRLTATA
jgi:putative zinc finger/helix-turn-helix YgiT family protein